MVTQRKIREAQDKIRRMTPEVYDYAQSRQVVAEDVKTQPWFIRGFAKYLTPESEWLGRRDKQLRAEIAKEHFEATHEIVGGARLDRMVWKELGYGE